MDKGGVRYLGISNVKISTLRELYGQARIKPTFVQNWFRKATEYDRENMVFCREHGIKYQIFGVFDEANADLLDCVPVRRRAVEKSIDKHQALLQMLLGGAAKQKLQLCILDGTTNQTHMRENMAAVGQLTDLRDSGRSVLEDDWLALVFPS